MLNKSKEREMYIVPLTTTAERFQMANGFGGRKVSEAILRLTI